MFKRKFRKGPRSSFRRHGRPLARVRRTWIESVIIDPCSPQQIPLLSNLDGCVTTRWEQVLVNNQVLQDQFSDRASVKRILGNLQVAFAVLQGATDPNDVYLRLATATGSLFVQLIKRPIDAAGQTELPPDIWNTSSVISGYSEAKALKTWWHHWNAYDAFSTEAGATTVDGTVNTFGIAPRLHICGTTDSACVTITDGTLDPVVGVRLDAECVACGSLDMSTVSLVGNNGALRTPRVWNFAFDVRKSIALREDEQLVLDFQFRTPNQQAYTDWEMIVSGGAIKTLLQF